MVGQIPHHSPEYLYTVIGQVAKNATHKLGDDIVILQIVNVKLHVLD
jgi:hypothetical protein